MDQGGDQLLGGPIGHVSIFLSLRLEHQGWRRPFRVSDESTAGDRPLVGRHARSGETIVPIRSVAA